MWQGSQTWLLPMDGESWRRAEGRRIIEQVLGGNCLRSLKITGTYAIPKRKQKKMGITVACVNIKTLCHLRLQRHASQKFAHARSHGRRLYTHHIGFERSKATEKISASQAV